MPTYYITATDTDAGKTYITSQLLKAARVAGVDSFGLKPIASGISCKYFNPNEPSDIDFLLAAMQQDLTSDDINLYSFKPPIAPHIAAQEQNVAIDLQRIKEQASDIGDKNLLLIEGVGGWLVPFNETQTQADLVQLLDVPVLVVVKIKTGCINHALLTFEAIKSRGVTIKGWIANAVTDDISIKNIQAIEQFSGIRCLASIEQENQSVVQIMNDLSSSSNRTSNPNLKGFQTLLDCL